MSENQSAESRKEVQRSETATAVQADKKVLGTMELLTEVTKFTLFGVFSLYALGFLIWHAYLSDYGVASLQFLQIEYLSAAFCYLLVVALFGVPAALIWEEWFSTVRKRHAPPQASAASIKPPNEFTRRAGAIATVWLLMLTQLTRHIFTYTSTDPGSARQFWLNIVYFFLALIGFFIILHAGKALLLRRCKNGRYEYLIKRFDPNVCFAAGVCLYSLWSNSSVSKEFLLVTIGFYPLVSIHLWSTEGRHAVRTVVIIGIVIAIIVHAQFFGTQQFGKIARGWGGGKPELAYVKFSANQPDIAASLSLSPVQDVPSLKGFFGPVSILLRSDKELVFVNYAELKTPLYATNDVFAGVSTNTTVSLVTNVTGPVLVGAGKWPTNQYSATLVYQATNYIRTNLTRNLVPNPTRLTAKQVRADAVDVLVYAK